MAVTLYKSTDASAPSLNGNAGSLISVLDACLVNGYGSQPAAGWTKAFSGTNKASYRQGSGPMHYLDVDDSGPGAATTQEARIRGYETMTAVGTGTGPFPTVAQVAGPNCRKSVATGTTARAWFLVADARTFYFWAATEVAIGSSGAYWGFAFGDIYSLAGSGDTYKTQIICRVTENSVSTTGDTLPKAGSFSGGLLGHYQARDYTGLGGSKNNTKIGGPLGIMAQVSIGEIGGSTGVGAPNLVDGKLYFAPILVQDATAVSVRGRLRGAYEPQFKPAGYSDGDTVAGEGALSGHTLLLVKGFALDSSSAIAFDITGPWETN